MATSGLDFSKINIQFDKPSQSEINNRKFRQLFGGGLYDESLLIQALDQAIKNERVKGGSLYDEPLLVQALDQGIEKARSKGSNFPNQRLL